MVIEKNASSGIKVAGTAVSGKDAIEICSHEAVDIIITDIKMPDMNGLELVKKVKGLYAHIQFVIISNYEDFSYAKQGIQLGVSDYLLKAGITDKDILNCILGLRTEIIQNRTAKGLMETDPQSRQLIQQYCLENIFSRGATPRQQETMFAKLSLDFTEDNLFLLVFSSDHFSGNIDSNDINRVLTIIQNRIRLKIPKSVVFHNKDGNIISIVHTVFNGLKSAYEQLFTIASILLREIGEYTGLSFSCAISSHFNSFKDMNS
jgi:two-component system response regulator YesN